MIDTVTVSVKSGRKPNRIFLMRFFHVRAAKNQPSEQTVLELPEQNAQRIVTQLQNVLRSL